MIKKFTLILAIIFLLISCNSVSAFDNEKVNADVQISEYTLLDEVVESRTANTKTFKTSDGRFMQAIYPGKVHYKSGDKWEEIDNTLVDKDGYLTNTAGDYKVKFNKETTDGLIYVEIGGRNISWQLEQSNNSKITKKDLPQKEDLSEEDIKTQTKPLKSKAEYNNIQDGIDIDYTIEPERIKEDIIISSKQASNKNFTFKVLTDGLSLVLNDDNSISFKDGDTELYKFISPYMIDASGETSSDIKQILTTIIDNQEYVLTINPDNKWLNDKERAYPVTLDPTLSIPQEFSPVTDAYVVSSSPTICFGSSLTMAVGYTANACSADVIRRSFIKFDVNPIPHNGSIDFALLHLERYDSNNNTTNSIEIHRLTSSFDEQYTTYNNQPSYDSDVEQTITPYTGSYNYGLTSIVTKWADGSYTNYGIMLKDSNEGISPSLLPVSYWTRHNASYEPLVKIMYTITHPIENGVYFLKNRETNKYVDIDGPSAEDDVQIHQWDFHGYNSQRWEFNMEGDGYYRIKSLYSNKYLQVENNSTNNDINIIQKSYDASADGQKWDVVSTSGGAYKIIPKTGEQNQRVMAVGWYLLNSNGINIQQRDYVDDTNYKDEWFFQPSNIDATLIGIPFTGHDHESYMSPVSDDLNNRNFSIINTFTYISKTDCLESLVSSDVFAIRTHGNFNLIALNDENLYISDLDQICSLSNQLIYYGACLTGEGGEYATNLVNATYNKGPQTVIGFTVSVYCDETNIWTEHFFDSLGYGSYIYAACDLADYYVSIYSSTDTTTNRLIRGLTNVAISN